MAKIVIKMPVRNCMATKEKSQIQKGKKKDLKVHSQSFLDKERDSPAYSMALLWRQDKCMSQTD